MNPKNNNFQKPPQLSKAAQRLKAQNARFEKAIKKYDDKFQAYKDETADKIDDLEAKVKAFESLPWYTKIWRAFMELFGKKKAILET